MSQEDLRLKMNRRTSIDGIPRSIVNGKIMKHDWVLLGDLQLSQEELEEHVETLISAWRADNE